VGHRALGLGRIANKDLGTLSGCAPRMPTPLAAWSRGLRLDGGEPLLISADLSKPPDPPDSRYLVKILRGARVKWLHPRGLQTNQKLIDKNRVRIGEECEAFVRGGHSGSSRSESAWL
jgi:hypothetical protein